MASSRASSGRQTEMLPSPARLRAATGADQEWLATAAVSEPTVAVACALVERCSDGAYRGDDLLDRAIGERVTLVWELRRLTFGNALDAVVECTGCGEKLDASLTVSDLAGRPAAADSAWESSSPFTVELDGRCVRFRLPTGRDQVAVAGEPEPVRSLWRRIVVDVDGTPPAALEDATVDALVDPLGESVAELDPWADTVIALACPTCGADIVAELDAFAYVREELVGGLDALLGEIHVLASHYHWSEADILSLPVERRRAYLELIADGAGR